MTLVTRKFTAFEVNCNTEEERAPAPDRPTANTFSSCAGKTPQYKEA